ncbi:PREDICTED: germin-like protein subfamily 1 member 6 [Camelina sativa]|uniref:Germin-like protein n=1 Tax=Camelina sativa TaxID=90675 RepID=A0ABM0SLD3_CAMSA|nr:PREDICTED: germin-like protein subfamily 1 member 6 [Camelina sativa]
MELLLRLLVAHVILLALSYSFVYCYDPSPLQDFCVAANETNGVFVNGKVCKDPKSVTANDFSYSGLNIPGNTTSFIGSNVTTVDVNKIPGLNTLGVSLARLDFARGGQNPPHIHPRASEILMVTKGTLLVGFVSSNQDNNRLFSKVLRTGDVFVFPIGLIHFQMNVGRTRAVAFAGFGSQNPGTITIADAVFGSSPSIPREVLAKAFQLDANLVRFLQIVYGPALWS